MSTHRVWSILVFCGCLAVSVARAEPFVTFPEQKEFVSPDGRYVLRSIDPPRDSSNFSWTFHTLVLEDRVTGKSRRLYDYLHKVAVAWSGNRIIATDYVSRRAARALVFSTAPMADAYLIDSTALADRIPLPLASHLRLNDHVFVEAVRLEGDTLVLRAWGYGAHDPGGFRLACRLNLDQAGAACEASARTPASP
jgi:hypothetical protein